MIRVWNCYCPCGSALMDLKPDTPLAWNGGPRRTMHARCAAGHDVTLKTGTDATGRGEVELEIDVEPESAPDWEASRVRRLH